MSSTVGRGLFIGSSVRLDSRNLRLTEEEKYSTVIISI